MFLSGSLAQSHRVSPRFVSSEVVGFLGRHKLVGTCSRVTAHFIIAKCRVPEETRFALVSKRGLRKPSTAKALQTVKRNLSRLYSQCKKSLFKLYPTSLQTPLWRSSQHTPPAAPSPSRTSKPTYHPQLCVRPASSPAPPTLRWWRTSASASVRSRPMLTCASSPTARPVLRSVRRLECAYRLSLPC